MKERKIEQSYKSMASVDGAGVKLSRVFWKKSTLDIDPFLLLDTFDSENPDDYTKGFPMHPHRGIETLTYLIDGEIVHKDTLENQDVIRHGESQWMSSGSGIMHDEMPQASSKMLGFQLWINISKDNKMSKPAYEALRVNDIPVYKDTNAIVKVIAGTFKGIKQSKMPNKHEVEVYDIELFENGIIEIPVKEFYNAFLIPLQGKIKVAGSVIENKTAVRLLDGDKVTIEAIDGAARIEFFAGEPLNEPIAWGGSIVMNTQEELNTAYRDLEVGTFIK